MIRIKEITADTISECICHLRQADKEEIQAFSAVNPVSSIVFSWKDSDDSGAVWHEDGTLLCVYGFRQTGWCTWEVWMLTTTAVEELQYARIFLKEGRRIIRSYLKKYPYMHNVVYAKNTVAIKWLKYIGCTFGEPVTINGEKFIPFLLRGERQCILTEANE